MPKKRAQSPDYTSFLERLEFCTKRLGNQNQLAIKSGIPQSTIRSYCEGVEPPRDYLMAIAKAADVSVGWLAAGVEPIEGTAAKTVEVDQELLRLFREKLDVAAKRAESYENLASRSGIESQEMDAIRFSRPPTISEIAAIARSASLDVREMLGLRFESDSTKESVTDEELWRRFESNIENLKIDNCGMLHLAAVIYQRFIGDPHRFFTQPDDTMERGILRNDLVIVKQQKEITIPDCYLFRRKVDAKEFIARAVPRDADLILSFDNSLYSRIGDFKYDPRMHRCLGRVVARLTPTRTG
jgi:hypothetical protein